MIPKCDLTKFSAEDKAWRNSLKVGDLIDVVKWDDTFNLKAWAKGKIEQIITGTGCNHENLGDANGVGVRRFMVTFPGDIGVQKSLIRADEPIIAPYLSKSHADSWRDNLQKYQQVDAMSRTMTWFKATVIEPDPREEAV